MENVCPCCLPAYFFPQFLGLSLLFYVSVRLLIRDKDSVLWKTILLLFHITFFLIAIIVLVLHTSSDIRALVFSRVYFIIANLEKLDPVRQDLLRDLSGRILEIGPGPGANFKYFSNNTAITEWVGVEPNTYFRQRQSEIIESLNLTMKTSTVWTRGESNVLDIEPESFDYVIGTHVLCSVENVTDVLGQIKRALKPSGEYKFYEHVLTDRDDTTRRYQQIAAPLFYYFGNGCQFRELWKDLEYHLSTEMLLHVDHLQADVSIPILKPHIVGSATKLSIG